MIVISKLPSAGLGNKLFAWASGAVLAKQNNCKHVVVGMTKFHIGPWLRKEKSKRLYVGYFNNEQSFKPLSTWFLKEIELKQVDCEKVISKKGYVSFSEIPHWSDYFKTLKKHREFIKKYFFDTLNKKVLNEFNTLLKPEIGIHIRMGDFRKLKENEEFANVGLVRTPMQYFEQTLIKIRKHCGYDIEATVFSDGSDEELKDILNLNKVIRAKDNKDILHLAQLSISKLLILSAGSSFSKWAAFLSDGIVIDHYQHIHNSIRDEEFNKKVYEGELAPNESIEDLPLLHLNLKTVFKKQFPRR